MLLLLLKEKKISSAKEEFLSIKSLDLDSQKAWIRIRITFSESGSDTNTVWNCITARIPFFLSKTFLVRYRYRTYLTIFLLNTIR
jgi:hypothetical protein